MSDFLYKTDDWYEKKQRPPAGERCEIQYGEHGWRECIVLSNSEVAIKISESGGHVIKPATPAHEFRPLYVRERKTIAAARSDFMQWDRETIGETADGDLKTPPDYRPIGYVLDGLYATGWLKPLRGEGDDE